MRRTRRYGAPASADEKTPCRYSIMKLHDHSALAWTVIESQRGAIAVSESGELIFRLSRENAKRIAADMNRRSREEASASPSVAD